jgi:hypothetical protein
MTSEIEFSIRDALVVPERKLWECIGPRGFEDQVSAWFLMTTCFAACALIEVGKPAEPLIRRVATVGGTQRGPALSARHPADHRGSGESRPGWIARRSSRGAVRVVNDCDRPEFLASRSGQPFLSAESNVETS